MRNRDAQVRELFDHVRKAVDLLEDIMLRPLSQEVQQKREAGPPNTERSPLELPKKMAYSIKEITALCAVSRSLIYREISEGRLRIVKLGKRSLVLAADLEAWMTKLPRSPS